MKRENSQEKAVLEKLTKNGHLSSLEAIHQMGITRLSAIIFNLREEGHIIETFRVTSTSKNRYGNPSRYCIYFYNGRDGVVNV